MRPIDRFFFFARRRYGILLQRRAGRPAPWTTDPILGQFRFCNIFREDDTTTIWIRRHITREAYGDRLLGAMVIARWFNRISTLERLLLPTGDETVDPLTDLLYNWGDTDEWRTAVRERLADVKPLVTGAYIVKTPAGMTKLEGLLECLGNVLPHAIELQGTIVANSPRMSLETVTDMLVAFPYIGPFIAYEVVTDLRHSILSSAPDIMRWASPGPGCTRGINRMLSLYDTNGELNRGRARDIERLQATMREILTQSRDPRHWQLDWPRWEMREVEHTLCEWDKYERTRLGEGTPKQRYSPGVG